MSRIFSFLNPITSNLQSGIFVALLALPLSMGISVASGFPAVAGVITAIIGGLITGALGGARLSIKGPAAGMIVIVLGAVTEFRETFPDSNVLGIVLAVVVVSGALQVLLGVLRFGALAELIPSSVISGMLAAVGVIIVGKQLHLVLGVSPESTSPVKLYAELPSSLLALNPAFTLIGLTSIALMVFWKKASFTWTKYIPDALLVVAVAMLLATLFGLYGRQDSYTLLGQSYTLNSSLFINMPERFFGAMIQPDWSALPTLLFVKHVILFALVGSLESVLIVEALNSFTSERDRADVNRDLIAVGLGNMVAGFLGAIPMISEIVRSRANIDAGATSSLSNGIHGALLLLAVVFLPTLLSSIPVAALAGLLVYVGMRLVNPGEFLVLKRLGGDQLFFFLLTLVVTLLTDILVGLGAGIISYALFVLISGRSICQLFVLCYQWSQQGSVAHFSVSGSANFINVHSLTKTIGKLPDSCSKIVIDLSNTTLVDHSFLAKLLRDAGKRSFADISIEGMSERHTSLSDHSLATRIRATNSKGVKT